MKRRNSFRGGPVTINKPVGGFSLIEILVVLVILLIGILAILRLFPGGFLTITRTGEMTAAQALVDQQLNGLHNQNTLTRAVGAGLPNNQGVIVPINGIRPDDLTDASTAELNALMQQYNFMLPNGYALHYFSNINRLRYITGETMRIPVATPNTVSSSTGPIYTLQYGPVFNIFHTDPNVNDYADSIKVYGSTMTRMELDATRAAGPDLAAAMSDGSMYAIDYAHNKIAFFPRPKYNGLSINPGASYRLYHFTAAIYQVDPNNIGKFITDHTDVTLRVDDQTVPAGLAITPVWQDLKLIDCKGADVSATAHVWGGTEQIARQFRLVTNSTGASAPFSDDPYEYSWYSAQLQSVNNTNLDANLGTLIFNPKAHIYNAGVDTTPQIGPSDPAYLNHVYGSADKGPLTDVNGLTVHIDYLTYDNHIIRDDRSVPINPPYNIRLSLPFVQTNGDILPDQSTYDGMFHEASGGATPDLILYNAATGQIVGQFGQSGTQSGVTGTLDPVTGLLSLDDASVANLNLQGAHLRVLYRTQKDYGMQIQQATAQYMPVPDPTCADFQSYYIGGSGPAGGSTNLLYFDISQAGKTVNIGEYYTVPTGGGASTHHTNETFQITDNPASFQQLNGKLYGVIDIGSGNKFDSTATGRAINNLQGASLKSRVIWKSGLRWRKVDNDTVLQSTGN